MATSANVIEYRILNKEGEQVGSHRQHMMCSTCNDNLEKFQPYEDFIIQPWGYDEEEDEWEGDRYNLKEWLLKHPAEITHKKFNVDDKVRVFIKGVLGVSKNRRVDGIVKEVKKGLWSNEYVVELETGEVIECDQNKVLPK